VGGNPSDLGTSKDIELVIPIAMTNPDCTGTTFGNVKADVLALKDMNYVRKNFRSIVLGSA
jgi:hypothetical protein